MTPWMVSCTVLLHNLWTYLADPGRVLENNDTLDGFMYCFVAQPMDLTCWPWKGLENRETLAGFMYCLVTQPMDLPSSPWKG